MAKVSPVGRVSYPSVFEPNEYKGKRSFQLTLLFDKDTDLSEMKEEAKRVADEKWGAGKRPKNFDNPFRDGDEKEDSPEYAGKIAVRFKRAEKRGAPQVIDAAKRTITENSGEFYAGCYARVSFTAFAWEEGKDGGVSFGLANIQKVRDGEPFDGRTTADEDFDVLDDTSTADVAF